MFKSINTAPFISENFQIFDIALYVLGLDIAHRNSLHYKVFQRCLFNFIFLRFKNLIFCIYSNDIAGNNFTQIIAFKNNVEGLIPGNIFKLQGDSAGHPITGNYIKPAYIGDEA